MVLAACRDTFRADGLPFLLVVLSQIAFFRESAAVRRYPWTRSLIGVFLLAPLSGCAENSMVLKGQLNRLQEERIATSRQLQELQKRATTLDQSNQELESLVAQYQRQTQLLNDQVKVTREQLGGVSAQLAKLRDEKQAVQQHAQALTASMRRRGAVTIKPNNSYLATLPQIDYPNVQVRRDGDVIRVELPGSALFQAGSAQLRTEGVQIVRTVAAELARAYPDHMIGVDGHTDSDPIQNALWRNNMQLSVARAMAVHELLVSQSRLRPEQLIVVGRGRSQPVVSNATAAGKQRNRRVELVVYPDKIR
jgi:chemotaxis protein MotB